MKRKFLILASVVVFIFFVAVGSVYAANNTLEDLAKTFNNCQSVEKYKQTNYDLSANVEGSKLIITSKTGEDTKKIEYEIKDSILTIESQDVNSLFVTSILIDCVGQLNGYKDGELFETLNSDDIENYSLANEGFEKKELENGAYRISVDINKKIPLVDMSNVYLKPKDLDILKMIVESGDVGTTNGTKLKMSYDISIMDSVEIYIGERDQITDSTYKSILSVIEVIFGENAKNDFSSKYTSMKDGSKTFDKYSVEVDLKVDEDMTTIKDGFKVTKVIIKDSTVKNNPIETIGTEDTEIEATNENLEKKDNNNLVLYIVLGGVALIIVMSIVVIAVRKKNK